MSQNSSNEFVDLNSFHLAGIIPIAGQPLDFEFPWHDCMTPIAANFLAIERAVLECATAGCETIWIVCPSDMQPLLKYRLGEMVQDPVWISRKFDVFPSEGKYIDVVQSDGDSIVKLEAYADRILQFKKEVMYLINATRDSEYLEDTFVGKGIASPSASTKTDVGIAWANENGAYLYDGERVHNLTEGKIKDSDWETFTGTSTDVTYVPLKNKLIISGGTNGVDVFEYTFFTKSWSKSTSKLHSSKTNFVIDNNEAKYVASDGEIYYWDDSSSSSDSVRVITKDFDFGNPASRKKCFKFYVTYRGTEVSPFTLSSTTAQGSKDVDVTSTSSLLVGMKVTGNTVPNDTVVESITDADTFVMSNAAAGSNFGSNTLTFTYETLKLKVYYGTNGQDLTGNSFGTEVSTTSKFAGTSTSCYIEDDENESNIKGGLETTGGVWKQAELVPPSSINNVYSIQLHFKADGVVPSDFEINDITIVYREKPMK